MRIITKIAILPAMLLCLSACSDDNSGPGKQLLETIATYDGQGSEMANFSYRANGDSPLIKIFGRGHINEDRVEVGSRVLVRYRLAAGVDPLSGGEVELISVGRVLSDTVTVAQAAPQNPGPLYLLTINRSGEYLDLMSRMPLTDKRSIKATATPTVDGRADIYIDATAGTPEQTSATYATTTYASIRIGPVWNQTTTDSIVVHVENSNNIYQKEFIFRKSR